MQLEKANRTVWLVTERGRQIGQIHLDAWRQVDDLVIFTQDVVERRILLNLTASHAVQYLRRRRHLFNLNGKFFDVKSGLQDSESDGFMAFGAIPDFIKEADGAELEKELRQFVAIVDAVFPGLDAMLDRVAEELKSRHGVDLNFSLAARNGFDDRAVVTFTVPKGKTFCFWKNLHLDTDEQWQLYLVPPYHPIMRGAERAFLINGDTDVVINGTDNAFHEIKPPPEALCQHPPDIFSNHGFGYMKHPYKAEGQSFQLTFDLGLSLAQAAFEATLKLLKSALGLDGMYVSVSGGFKPPYDYPGNILNRQRRASPRADRRDEVRGSEGSCVWEYLTLEKEGMLKGARIPKWFHREGWLRIYGVK